MQINDKYSLFITAEQIFHNTYLYISVRTARHFSTGGKSQRQKVLAVEGLIKRDFGSLTIDGETSIHAFCASTIF